VRRALTAVVLACLVVVGSAAASTSREEAPIPATFVGDSISASLTYVPAARRKLARGIALELDVKVCRRLVQPSCSFQGKTPTTALQAVRAYGHSLGRVLIVDVGYNEGSQGYASGIDRVVRAALTQGAVGVVWVTLREKGRYGSLYHTTNRVIGKAARRWPQLVVADWNAYSAGRPWFGSDGFHLSPQGAIELASFVRPYVLRAASTE
jgi:hypothetical protein